MGFHGVKGLVLALLSGLVLARGAFGGEFLEDRRPRQAQAHYMLGVFHESSGNLDDALSEYDRALKLEKDIPFVHLHRGSVFIRKGDIPRAISELEQAKKLGPEELEPGFVLALLYSLQNSPDKASQEFEGVLKKAAELEPENISILKNLAGLYYQQKKLEEAVSACRLILKIDGKDFETLSLLGSLLEETGKRQEALDKFQEALKINPDYPQALNSLGYVYAQEGRNLEQAEGLIKKALEFEPDNGAYMDSLGWVYFQKNDLDKAQGYLERAAGLLEDAEIYSHLGELYFKKGALDKAAEAWDKSLILDPGQKDLKERLDNLKAK